MSSCGGLDAVLARRRAGLADDARGKGPGVGVFAFSTFDTDYLLVKGTDLPKAVAALRGAGHDVVPLTHSTEDQ